MPFIPHTEQDIKEMLAVIGETSIEALFDEIDDHLKIKKPLSLPPQLTEMELSRFMQERAQKDLAGLCYIGAGAYEHHIPAAVFDIASRGEWMTAYTPYQAEASQGTLQLLFEYQTMMSSLMSLDSSNASLYDGASALAEAILMAVRLSKQNQLSRIFIPRTVHPHYRDVVRAITQQQGIELVEVPYDVKTGQISVTELKTLAKEGMTALVIPQPNFFGILEEVDLLTDWAHAAKAKVIAVVNPMAMALLKPPGQWGTMGADIACGEGQPLGVPLASGGPYYGFLCCKQEWIRQLPGRVVGRTIDLSGKPGFVLTLQAREQHIRRAKATSNICTNQGWLVTASVIYMSLLGPNGLRQAALTSHHHTSLLRESLATIKGVRIPFQAPFFHELVVQFDLPVDVVLTELMRYHIQAGFNLRKTYPELGEALLICVTETKSPDDLQVLAKSLCDVLKKCVAVVSAADHSGSQ